jgi:hypothetical protein
MVPPLIAENAALAISAVRRGRSSFMLGSGVVATKMRRILGRGDYL